MERVLPSRSHLFIGVALVVALIWLSTASQHPSNPSSSPHVKSVSIKQAAGLIDGGALVIDVRNKEAFDYRHIAGAILIPLDELQAAIPALLAKEKDREIVLYCNHGTLHGPEATQILNNAGFAKAVNLESGIEGWDAAGMPVTRASGAPKTPA
jgi:rhodanese-related sulfurtransferase